MSAKANYVKVTLKRLPATDEWVVRLWDVNGRRLAEADYYTNSKADAVATKAKLEAALQPNPSHDEARLDFWVQERIELLDGSVRWSDSVGWTAELGWTETTALREFKAVYSDDSGNYRLIRREVKEVIMR
jgi:hypothetical protein